MGNNLEIDLSKYGCTCFNQEDGGFLDFTGDLFSKATPYFTNFLNEKEKDKNLSKSNFSTFTTQRMVPNMVNQNKKYESFTINPQDNLNDNLNIDSLKEKNQKHNEDKENSLFEDKNYLKEFEYSESEVNQSNQSNNEISINSKKKNMERDDDINDEEEEEEENEDINNFNLKTDYFQLANQISESIKELKNNIFYENGSTPTPTPKTLNEDDFENALNRAGKSCDNICFNDIIGCIRKISDIDSEVSLINERLYLALVNKFKRTYSLTHYINFSDEKKVVEIPNFKRIKIEDRAKLGKFNNPNFKFNKFTLKGSFPNEILIWKLISQNMKEITDIMKDNYYCCAVLLHKGKREDENETIIYFINKIAK
jgi:hypothetical protein